MAGEPTLYARMELRLNDFEKKLARATKSADGAMSKIERRGDRMSSRLASVGAGAFSGLAKGAAGVLLPLLTASAAINGTKAALDAFGAVADNAAAAGLDAEFWQSLAYQASLGGVAIDQVSAALATFAKNSGLAAEGKGRMVTSLKALDPVLLENIRKATTQESRIRLVADALAKETDASKKAAIATAAFGDAGLKLANVFAGGAAQIDAMAAKARDLGLIVDRDVIAKADEIGDSFDTTSQILDVKVKTALVNLGPLLVWLTGLTGDLAAAAGAVFDSFNGIGNRATSTLEAQLTALRDSMSKPIGFGGTLQGMFDPAAVKAEIAKIEAEIFRRADQASVVKLKGIAPTSADIPSLDDIETRNASAAAAVKQAEAVKELISNLEFEASLLGTSETDQAVATALRQAGAAATVEQKARIEELIRSMDAERTAIEANQQAMAEFGDIAKSATRSMIDDLLQGKTAAEAFGNVLSDIGNRLLSLGLDSLFGTGNGNLGLLGQLIGIPGRAAGGPVSAGQPYVVGEKRPELFVPSVSGRIIPHVPSMPSLASGGGAVSAPVTINIDATGADAAAIGRLSGELSRLKADLPATVVSAVRKARSTGNL